MIEREDEGVQSPAIDSDQTREPELPASPTPRPADIVGVQRSQFLSDALYRYGLVLVWVVTMVIFSILRPDTFPTAGNMRAILGSQSVLALITLALVLPLIVGEFDLSIGANLGLSAIVVTVLNVQAGWPIGYAVAVAVALGAVIGMANGYFVIIVGVNALVVTLGIATLLTGIGYAVSNYLIVTGVSPLLTGAVNYKIFGLPLSFYYVILLASVMWYVFRYTPLGRHLIFVGAGPEVARLSGLPVTRLRFGAFVVGGVLSAFAGILLAGTLGGEDPNAGAGFLLPAFSAAFLGAATVTPGLFNPWGALIAVYFLVTGISGLQMLGLNDWIQNVFYGAALVAAITLSHLATKRRVAGGR